MAPPADIVGLGQQMKPEHAAVKPEGGTRGNDRCQLGTRRGHFQAASDAPELICGPSRGGRYRRYKRPFGNNAEFSFGLYPRAGPEIGENGHLAAKLTISATFGSH